MHDPQQRTVRIIPTVVGSRFFTAPTFQETVGEPELKAHFLPADEIRKRQKGKREMRYAAYMRVSSEEQVGNFSIDAQRRAIEAWVKAREGQLVKLYIDEGLSGRTADRPEFQQMRRDAKAKKFDALVVHKFDRFARNRTDALAIKSLLRQDYGIKVFSASEPSEDSDGPIGALIEGIMECVADWYSRNLAAETVKGKRERAMQGYHNNRPPFGFDKDEAGMLIPNEHELLGLKAAFDLYKTGKYSDTEIAVILNGDGFRSKTGRPFSTETIRDMLQNRTYLGYVRYQPYQQHSDGSRSWDIAEEWFKGKHEAVIAQDAFDLCQEVRAVKASHHEYFPKHRVYLLRDIIFCADCVANMPATVTDDAYGKMRPHSNGDGKYLLYRCRARSWGRKCPQGSVKADDIDEQVVKFLKVLKPPEDWRKRMVVAMGQLLGDTKLDERLKEVKTIIERMDFRWDNGFITDKDAYLAQRVKLQQELEQLAPMADDELETAADLLEHFTAHWEATNGDRQQQQRLIQLIVARVWIRGDKVVGLSLRPNFHVTVGLESDKSTNMSVDYLEDGNFVLNRERRGSNPRSSA